jgi:hypothetical protein
MFKSRCLLALVFLGSIVFLPLASWANAIHPDPASICDAVAGNLVKNCGFETGDFSDWTVTHAALDSNIGVSNGIFAHSGRFSAFFGAGRDEDSISQVLSTTAGRAFHLSFFLTNTFTLPAGLADFSASWDGTRLFSAPITAFGYTQFSFVVPGTGRDTLQFAGRNVTSFFGLDDIVVTPVPEPGTLSLFGLGLLLGCAFLCRKKKLLNGTQA